MEFADATRTSVRNYTPKHLQQAGLANRAAMQGQRKQVTVLFVDIKGSSAVAAQLDAERWHEILDGYFALLTEAVHRFEGTVNQYTGDGIMALFGAPIAHEDHALRACMAAVQLRSELRHYFDELRRSDAVNLSARVGMNSGFVVVGSIGDDLRMDYTAQGHTVNLAARFEQLCEPGEIYLSGDTAELVQEHAQLRPLGDLHIRGLDDPVAGYALEAVAGDRTRLDRSRARGLSRLVGREQELTRLKHWFDQLADGDCAHNRQLVISGDAGIGKSRLCEEFLRSCEAPDVRILRATGVPYQSALPLFPVAGLFRSLFAIREDEPAASLRQRIAGELVLAKPALRETLPAVFDLLGIAQAGDLRRELTPELRRRLLIDALIGALTVDGQRFIICIDDIHWLDERSEQLLKELAARCCELPGVFLVNHRPGLAAPWLAGIETIALRPLDAADMHRLAMDWLDDGEAEQALASQLAERAAGNPYFVEETLHSLRSAGQLTGERGALRVTGPVEALALPETVQAIIAGRIDTLAPPSIRALHHAAVIGRHFNSDTLGQLLDLDDGALQPILKALEQGRFVALEPHCNEHESGQDYEFVHPITQEVAYESQLGADRRAIHARIGDLIEQRLAAARWENELTAQAAHHFTAAQIWDKSVHWSLRAAVWAGNTDLHDSVDRYRALIRLIDERGLRATHREGAISARAGVLRAASLIPVDADEIGRCFEEANAMAEHASLAVRAELQVSLAQSRLFGGDAVAAREAVLAAVDMVRGSGAESLVARFRIPILLSFYATGNLEEGLELADSVDEAWTSGAPTDENFASRAFRATMISTMGRLSEGERELNAALAVATARGQAVSWIHANLAEVAAFFGQVEHAMHEAVQAVREAEEFASPFFLAVAYRALAQAHSLQGDFVRAREILLQRRDHVRAGHAGHQFEGAHLAQLANAHLGCKETDAAIAVAREAIASATRGGLRIWELRAQIALTRALRRSGAIDDAHAAANRAKLLVARTGAQCHAPFLNLELAKLASVRGDQAGAESSLRQALQGFQQMGATIYAEQLERLTQDPEAGAMRPLPV